MIDWPAALSWNCEIRSPCKRCFSCVCSLPEIQSLRFFCLKCNWAILGRARNCFQIQEDNCFLLTQVSWDLTQDKKRVLSKGSLPESQYTNSTTRIKNWSAYKRIVKSSLQCVLPFLWWNQFKLWPLELRDFAKRWAVLPPSGPGNTCDPHATGIENGRVGHSCDNLQPWFFYFKASQGELWRSFYPKFSIYELFKNEKSGW